MIKEYELKSIEGVNAKEVEALKIKLESSSNLEDFLVVKYDPNELGPIAAEELGRQLQLLYEKVLLVPNHLTFSFFKFEEVKKREKHTQGEEDILLMDFLDEHWKREYYRSRLFDTKEEKEEKEIRPKKFFSNPPPPGSLFADGLHYRAGKSNLVDQWAAATALIGTEDVKPITSKKPASPPVKHLSSEPAPIHINTDSYIRKWRDEE